MIKLQSGDKDFPAYLATPAGKIKGGLIVIHEVWGLTDHIKDVADRLTKEGYLALAPDLMHEAGITEMATDQLAEDLFNPEKRNQVQPQLRALMTPLHQPDFAEHTLAKLKVCFDYLYQKADGKVAVIGFCFGGTYSFSLAATEPRLKLALPFYGHADMSVEDLRRIACPVRAFYGANDERLMAALPELKAKMKQAGVDFKTHVYPSAGHAFFNDTNKFAYNEPAAKDAWQKLLAYLQESLFLR
ncbi:MAG TPA: dienelactone hydrolase family protein [Candidatus Saccharimonadales bacterium]|jgi:carboxymethylenebutenolidase|nr:dienelactone hydrolase family protein [Candidatus Saccharimonadales bacterium]